MKLKEGKYYPPIMADLMGRPDNIRTKNYLLGVKKPRYPADKNAMMKDGMIPGDYLILYSIQRKCIVMSDTPMERYTNQKFIDSAYGDVLIGGLGIGMVPAALARNPQVKSITIVEKDPELIGLIGPRLKKAVTSVPIKIIEGDAYTYPRNLQRPEHYDWAYIDIWDNYPGHSDLLWMLEMVKRAYSTVADNFDAWGYEDARTGAGNPIKTEDYKLYLKNMQAYYGSSGRISLDLLQNGMTYMLDAGI